MVLAAVRRSTPSKRPDDSGSSGYRGARHLPHQPGGPRATSESARARRFALPDLDDERADESIQAFIDGPEVWRHRRVTEPGVEARVQRPDVGAQRLDGGANRPASRSSASLASIAGRLEWSAALARESVRARRYGRPTSVAILELRPDRAGQSVEPWLRSVVGPVANTLRRGCRATDLVARVASTRFQVLLPETTEDGASRFAERVADECRAVLRSTPAPVSVRLSVAAASREQSLDQAVANAVRAIGGS